MWRRILPWEFIEPTTEPTGVGNKLNQGKKLRHMHDLPITQHLESAWQASVTPSHFWEVDDDLFEIPAAPSKPDCRLRAMKGDGKQQEEMNGSVRPTAVDEDLYKIPPELSLSEAQVQDEKNAEELVVRVPQS